MKEMVEKVFWDDPYLTHLGAEVRTVDADDVTLDRTLFYAFSGGQESDTGTIAGQPVLNARKTGPEIIYTLAKNHGLTPGQRVWIEIDWPRRYRLMRLHFACEITLELVYQAIPGIEKIGAHIAEDKARIDFQYAHNMSPLFDDLTQRITALIEQNRPIFSEYSDEDGERRFWRIDDFAQVPCGGTHLRKTGEIGQVTLKRKNPGKGKERIEITVDD